jgi:uncharacterized membrane protein
MKKILLILVLFLFVVSPVFAQTAPPKTHIQQFFRATVAQVIEEGYNDGGGSKNYYQTIRVIIKDGTLKGKYTVIQNGQDSSISKNQLFKEGDEIIVSQTFSPNGGNVYSIYDAYRLSMIFIFLIIFFITILLIAGLKGFGSILGMVISLLIILLFIIPNILKGSDPLTVTLIGSTIIIVLTTYLAHGISKKTSIALFSTLISLGLTATFAIFAISLTKITGLGNEDFYTLQLGPTSIINIQGLFLSAIIIGTLGALNDITTTQSATILELKKLDSKLKFKDLFQKGLAVGKEHIASLVNTLVLAYAGSSFAIFIFFVLNPAKIPYWVILNNEIVADEVIKIIAGSVGLLLCVPIVTLIASYVFSRKNS